jgi:hypothetical protein
MQCSPPKFKEFPYWSSTAAQVPRVKLPPHEPDPHMLVHGDIVILASQELQIRGFSARAQALGPRGGPRGAPSVHTLVRQSRSLGQADAQAWPLLK